MNNLKSLSRNVAVLFVLLLIGTAFAAAQANKTGSGLSAEQVLQQALLQMQSSGKAGFFEVSSPGCGWCIRMNKLFTIGEAAEILRRYYVYIPVDLVENPGTADFAKTLGRTKETGTPWFAVINDKRQTLATSDGPAGNIGFPANDQERAHFLSVLRSTAKGISVEEISAIEKIVKAAVEKPSK